MKKVIILSIASIMVVLLAVVLVSNQAHAEDGKNKSTGNSISSTSGLKLGLTKMDDEGLKLGDTQESISVRPNGDFQITGVTVVSVDASGTTITGTLFGITRTVNVSGAVLMGGRAIISLGDIKSGDKLSADGNFNESTKTVMVKHINDVSYKKTQDASNLQARIQQLLDLVAKLQAQLQGLQH